MDPGVAVLHPEAAHEAKCIAQTFHFTKLQDGNRSRHTAEAAGRAGHLALHIFYWTYLEPHANMRLVQLCICTCAAKAAITNTKPISVLRFYTESCQGPFWHPVYATMIGACQVLAPAVCMPHCSADSSTPWLFSSATILSPHAVT
jgi:hypothetical protein